MNGALPFEVIEDKMGEKGVDGDLRRHRDHFANRCPTPNSNPPGKASIGPTVLRMDLIIIAFRPNSRSFLRLWPLRGFFVPSCG
jgi:hypothetical protein